MGTEMDKNKGHQMHTTICRGLSREITLNGE